MERDSMLKVVDLFCGCGGMSLGFSEAGFDVVAAFDNWEPAIEVHRLNLDVPVFNADLADVDASVALIEPFDPDIIIGGPPCQDFSIAGNRDETAGRASLTLSFADIVTKIRPKCFVMENVYTAPKSKTYAEAFRRFREAGYGLTLKILDASLCGVPQARKRAFTIGLLDGADDALLGELEAHLADKQMTVRDYLGDILGTQYYFCIPRSYKRRAVFSIDEPSSTVRGMNRPIPSTYKRHSADVADASESRVLTEEERGWIQTFPKWFKWQGSKGVVNQMIGNAVPVNMSRYVAMALKMYLDDAEMSEMVSSTFESDALR